MSRQITSSPHGHVLTNFGVWSGDGRWIVYDTRSDPAGSNFDGARIEAVEVATGRVVMLYESQNGANCGVVTCSPVADRAAFILGPEQPTADWTYCAHRRRGMIVDFSTLRISLLDAHNYAPPFTPGALRGGTHVHVFDGAGEWISFTYEDEVLAAGERASDFDPQRADRNQRNVGVAIPIAVTPQPTHPRNHPGDYFSVLVTRTVNAPRPGSDEISRAYEDAWVGVNGYECADGSRQRALAFLGDVRAAYGQQHTELFIVDLPDDLRRAGAEPLEGTLTRRPAPPAGVVQRRLTFTAGLSGPRFWPRSSPDGSRIAFLMPDERGVVQLWTISPLGGEPVQLTNGKHPIASAFTWRPDGKRIAAVVDGSVMAVHSHTGAMQRLTPRVTDESAPRPEACVYSPDGCQIAYSRVIAGWNQIFVAEC